LHHVVQTALLKYSGFNPDYDNSEDGSEKSDESLDKTRVGSVVNGVGSNRRWGFPFSKKRKDRRGAKAVCAQIEEPEPKKERLKPAKKIPVLFFDEAHKLYARIYFLLVPSVILLC
jgi:hypothetical protein